MNKLRRIFLGTAIIFLMPVLAEAQTVPEGGVSFMIWLFMGFGALIIIFQLFPGLALFVIMLKEIFSRVPAKAPMATMEKAKK